MVLFTMNIGFFAGYAKEPDLEDIEGAICALNDYIDEDLRHALVDEDVKASLYLIKWKYTEGEIKPVSIDFAVEGVSGSGERVPDHTLFAALKLDSGDLADLIQNYMWTASPNVNVFHDASQIGIQASTGVPTQPLETLTPITCSYDGKC